MIDAGADDIHIVGRHLLVGPDHAFALRPKLNDVGNLPMPALNTGHKPMVWTPPYLLQAQVFIAIGWSS